MANNVCLPFKLCRSQALLEPYAGSNPQRDTPVAHGRSWRCLADSGGEHLRSLAAMVMRSDSEVWLQRLGAWSMKGSANRIRLNYLGESDRAACDR